MVSEFTFPSRFPVFIFYKIKPESVSSIFYTSTNIPGAYPTINLRIQLFLHIQHIRRSGNDPSDPNHELQSPTQESNPGS